ncbi:alpha/beta hydrolase [Marinobacter lacisalsi]|uniref:Alpha/beta hydrolase n=1 Tax=Marinobacter lacisalsi TaxID=475979 RepID=A0ABV8QG67_9GAMM
MEARIPRLLLIVTLTSLGLLQSGCTSLFFFPDRQVYITPDRLELAHDEIWIDTPDGETLHAWWLPAQGNARGHVYFLHGNAQNISSHILNVAWLPEAGYNVLLIDYRGYGQSSGAPDLEGALHDAETGLRWLGRERDTDELPLYLLGQSLGGAVAITLASEWVPRNEHPPLSGVIADSTFSGFRAIAREKLDNFWLTWPFQIPLSWTVTDQYEGVDLIGRISPVPVMIIHSVRDGIIPIHHGLALYEAAEEPKRFLRTDMPHAGSFMLPEYQEALLRFMEESSSR